MGINPKLGFTLKQGPTKLRHPNIMTLIQNFLQSIRSALTIQTQQESDEQFLSHAVDHADLERRLAHQARAYMAMAPMNIGR